MKNHATSSEERVARQPEKVIAHEVTGIIRCTECNETIQAQHYTGFFHDYIAFQDAANRFTESHAKAHGWKEAA